MGKKRLRPWLETQINERKFPGLRFIDENKRIFSFPWKDQKKKGMSRDGEDTQIIKAWAIHSGMHKEGDPEKLPLWKARIRTALAKLNDVQEVRELHNLFDQKNPYRAYKLVSASGNKSIASSSNSSTCSIAQLESSESELSMDFLGPFNAEVNIARNHTNIPTVVYEKGKFQSGQDIGMDAYVSPPQLFEMSPPDLINDASSNALDLDMPSLYQHQSHLPSDLADLNDSSLMTFHSKLTENNISFGSSLPSMEPPFTNGSENNQILKIKVYFMEKCVLEEFIDEKGARLFCGNPLMHSETERMIGDETVYGPMNLKQIALPDLDEMAELQFADENKQKKISELQAAMERGLILRISEGNISAERLCRNRVFIKTQEGKIEQLKRENRAPVCVFDLDLFKRQLLNHITENGPQPSPSIMFTFGQEYKANKKTWLSFKVTHKEAENLLIQAVDSKPDNVEVLFSSKNPDDILADLFKGKLSV